MNSITETRPLSKIRPNLFQLPTGEVIGYGAILAPGGLGFCFNCKAADCQHVVTVDEDWLAGGHSVESTAIPTAWWTVNGIDDFSIDRKTGKVTL